MRFSPLLAGATLSCAGALVAQATQPVLLSRSDTARKLFPITDPTDQGFLAGSFLLGEPSFGAIGPYQRKSSWIAIDARTGARRYLMRQNPSGPTGSWSRGVTGKGFAACIALDSAGQAHSLVWTDGTAESGRVLASLTGPAVRPVLFGKLVAFVGHDTSNGREPWLSDGTTAGTRLLADLTPGTTSSDVRDLAVWRDRLFFVLRTSSGDLVYTSDGTAAGTRQLFAVTGTGATNAGFLFGWKPTSSLLFYAADDGAGRRGLWCIDPVTALPRFLKQEGGWTSGPVDPLTHLAAERSGGLMFTGSDGSGGTELWYSDGTTTGTRRVADIVAGPGSSDPDGLTTVSGGVVFTAKTPTAGREPWFSDGTAAGTRMLADLAAGTGDGMVSRLVGDGQKAFFAGDTGNGRPQLYAADQAGAVRLTNGTMLVSSFQPMAAAQGQLLAMGLANGDEWWLSDGTPQGTFRIPEFGFSFTNAYPVQLMGRTPGFALLSYGTGVWMRLTDGTTAGTVMLNGFDYPNPQQAPLATSFGSGLYFVARQQNSGDILFRTDGTTAGTVGVHPILPAEMLAFGDKLLLSGSYPNYGQDRELWVSDGTRSGTFMLADLAPGSASSSPSGMVRHLDRVFFNADIPGAGRELCVTDGTAKGTVLVADLVPGTGSSDPHGLFSHNGLLWFTAYDQSLVEWLWVSDGTAQGTWTVGPDMYPFTRPVAFRNGVAFVGQDSIAGAEPWFSDGTKAGTLRLGDLASGSTDSAPSAFTVTHDLLFFWARNSQGNLQVWRSDATALGTFALTSFGFGSSGPDRIWALRDGILFSAPTGNDNSDSLWFSDGTLLGTRRLLDHGEGRKVEGAAAGEARDRLFLRIADLDHGSETWVSDGTVAGTTPMPELWPGPNASQPTVTASLGSRLLVVGTHEFWGQGLFAYEDLALTRPVSEACTRRAQPVGFDAGDGFVGRTLHLRLSELPPGTAGVVFAGAGRDFGLPFAGCELWFDPLVSLVLGVGAPTPTWDLAVAVPADTALIGAQVTAQGVLLVSTPTPAFETTRALSLGLGR